MSKKVGELRPSQFITTFGPGAIVDLPDYSVIIGGIDKWDSLDVSKAQTIEEPRVMKKLKIKQIKSIPINDKDEFGTIPAYRFPEYHVCPNCRKLGKRDGHDFFEEEGVLYCKNPDNEKGPCPKVKTHPVRFITACKNGHISDFPWLFYVHKGEKYDFKKCKLYLIDEGKTGSLKDLVVSCSTCGKERSISEALYNNKILGKCSGSRPWLRDKEDMCEEDNELLLRGASNIYFSSIESSLLIPSNAENIDEFIKDHINFEDEELISDKRVFDTVMKRDPDIQRIGIDKAWAIVQRIKNKINSDYDLRTPEYQALLTEHNNYDDINFQTEKESVPERYNHLITNLIRVKRLKEVMVLKGFTRIQPLPDVTSILSDQASNNNEDKPRKDVVEIAPISNVKLDWLLGVETYGEGIFITINNDLLEDWESKRRQYEIGMEVAHKKIYKERDFPDEAIPAFPGIRYALLHTLSHALIREFTLHSGYSSSALKERIYSDPENGMAGILIYTSTVDSEGSLGGLVELGRRDKFEMILARALAAARYCSGDPQCAEHDAEHFSDVNGAACHSCMLISETSCEKSNRYLDRSLLVETVANAKREFFHIE
ncbi:DrmB family protein [Niallia sp. Krafla_26]|uniref:DrmB family protein n=1 Tax=Niallia sp. Krafla_26 TaxID=3064703 RepID=UPI003D16E893